MKNRIKNRVLDIIAIGIIAREINAEMKYDEMIAESQAKIGPYKPATIPVQVWA
jgi:hypothetical protein